MQYIFVLSSYLYVIIGLVSYERPTLDDETKPKKYACFNRLPSSITEA